MVTPSPPHRSDDLAMLRRTVAELSFLQRLSRITASALDPEVLFGVIIRETCEVMRTEVCSLYVVEGSDVVLMATNGLNPAGVGTARMPIGVGITGAVAAGGEPIAAADAAADPRFNWIDGLDQERFTSMCSVPLISGGARVVGVLNVQSVDERVWSIDEQAALVAIAAQLAGIIERSELHRQLEAQLVEAREATRRWRRLTQEKSDLLSMVSHDVRTPLAITRTYVDALAERLDGETLEVVRQLDAELGHIERMVETILSALALEAGAVSLVRRPVTLAPLVRDACTALGRTAPDRRIVVDADGSVVSDVDPDTIRQVLDNLVVNAIRHAPGGTSIEVSLRRVGDSVELAVRDHGSGIDPDQAVELFERFRRGAGGGPGTGIGLFVVRTVVEAHGGRVEVENADGGGARFRVILPGG